MTPKQNTKNQAGFTLIELMVVIVIMGFMAAGVFINFGQQRQIRNLVLAKNETITNLRKVQSYLMSSRNITDNVPAKFYVVEFTVNSPTYKIEAVDNNFVYHDVETVRMPGDLSFGVITTVMTNGFYADTTLYQCVQVIFTAPFGDMYLKGSNSCGASNSAAIVDVVNDPVTLANLKADMSYLYFGGNAQGSRPADYILINRDTLQFFTN